MIIGLGIDIVELPRIARSWERFGPSFAQKILHADEVKALPSGAKIIPYLAARFAAKEAAVKALGTGFRQGIWFQDFCVVNNEAGQPGLLIFGAARKVFDSLGAKNAHISLSHGRDTAAAVVILEK